MLPTAGLLPLPKLVSPASAKAEPVFRTRVSVLPPPTLILVRYRRQSWCRRWLHLVLQVIAADKPPPRLLPMFPLPQLRPCFTARA